MALTVSEVSQRVTCAPVLAVMSSILLRSNRPARVARGLLPVRAKNPVRLPLVDLQASQPAIKTDQMRHFLIAQLDHRLSTSACVAMSSLRSARHSPRRARSMRLGHGVSPISHGKATSFSHQNPRLSTAVSSLLRQSKIRWPPILQRSEFFARDCQDSLLEILVAVA